MSIVLLSCLFAAGCSQRCTECSEISGEIQDRETLQGNTETKIPQNATDIHGFVDGFQELVTYARFTIPAQDLEEFLQSTTCASLESAVDADFRFPDSLDPLVSAKNGLKKGLNHGINKMLKSLNHEVRPLTSKIIPQKRWQW